MITSIILKEYLKVRNKMSVREKKKHISTHTNSTQYSQNNKIKIQEFHSKKTKNNNDNSKHSYLIKIYICDI